MKGKSVLLAMAMVLVVSSAWAAPFLACDDADIANVDSYIIEVDGVEYEAAFPMKYDLAGIVDGDHIIRAKAVNLWGQSDWSDPFEFSSGAAATPVGFGLTAD